DSVFRLRLYDSWADRLAAREGEESADRGTARQATGELAGAKNGRPRRNVSSRIADEPGQLRSTADAARVEHARCIAVEAEDAGAFEKEWPLLGQKRLERGEVELGGICFDLAEIRIHRRVESEIRRDAVLEIA